MQGRHKQETSLSATILNNKTIRNVPYYLYNCCKCPSSMVKSCFYAAHTNKPKTLTVTKLLAPKRQKTQYHSGLTVIAASMNGFANFQKFKSPVTLTLDRVKVTLACTIPVVLPARATI